ncbi:MAG: ABC transporter permease [Bacteroidetes bacterium]|nr:ABC transporter permease [Bacteroidota bacterium]
MLFIRENILIAFGAIKANKLRATITMLIISIGITALVGILSAIDAIKNGINNNFTNMGANTFTIRNADINIKVRRKGKSTNAFPKITFKEALMFKQKFNFPAITSISTMASGTARLKFESKKTNPNIQVFGSDENYINVSGYELEEGRNFLSDEITTGNNLVILGHEVAYSLFKNQKSAGNFIRIGAAKYKVIGVLKSKGSSSGFGGDKICIIPILNARQNFSKPDMSFTINVLCRSNQLLNVAFGEAQALFRNVRRLNTIEHNNFDVIKSDNLANILINNLKKVTIGATLIGLITLLGAAIGLMNIMLVSVTERTREIGVRKALGAAASTIKNQFLIESIVICICGGILGIFLGIAIGNIISLSLSTGFFIPWFWIISGLIICIVVGLLSGYIPAKRASELDPIDSLRFE